VLGGYWDTPDRPAVTIFVSQAGLEANRVTTGGTASTVRAFTADLDRDLL
jgi:hypothetical protein